MKYKWSALVLSLLLCLADKAGALTVYTENTEAQFTAGSHNSTYITGTGSNVTLSLDYYGHAAGLSAPGSDDWFNAAWKYRQPLSLNSTNQSALTNYPVAFTLNTQDAIAAGRMNADGSDIRFTTAAVSGSAASLSYYIESGINTNATKIWVKIPSVPTGAGTIYLYSGSTSAAAVSSLADTFTMGNNFNAGNGTVPSTAAWSNIESAAPQTGSVRDIQFNRLRLLFGSPLNTRYFGLRSASQYSFASGRHYRVDMNARDTGSDSWSSFTLCQAIYNNSYTQDDWLRFSIKHSASGPLYTVERSDYGTKTTLASGSVAAGFHGVDVLVNASSFTVLLDGTQIYSAANNLAFNSPYLYLEAASASSSLEEFLFDNVFVQSYSKPEPAYISPGAEQGRRYASGSFTSQIKDSSSTGTNYKAADWAAVMPSSSSVALEVRAHDTNILLSTFTSVAKGGDPSIFGRYVQYRLNLATLDPRYTASVSSLTLTYGSPPLAPGGAVGATLSDSSIKWNWTDTSSGQFQEDGFQVLDATGALKGSLAAGATYWIETSLNPNTLYTRQIIGYNSAGNGASTSTSKYTFAAPPNVGCDKSTGTWLSGTLTCTNLAGFGNNGVSYYRYAWTQTPDRAAWTGTETQWTSGQLLNTAASSGFYYLHVKSYNGENVPLSGYQTYGPYWYDKNAPSVAGFSPSSSPWTNSGLSSIVSLSDTGGAKLSRVRYRWTTSSDKPGSGWQAWDYTISGNDSAVPSFTIGSAGQWYLHVEVEDTAGNTGYAYSGIYKIDLTNPTGSITINNGDAYTPRTDVTLSLTYADSESGVKNLAYKNLGGGWSPTELPQATTAWVLSAGDGSKQVYVQVTDNSGRTYQNADTIMLDSRTSLLGAPVSGTASGVMGEAPGSFAARASLSWTPTGDNLQGKTLSFYFNGSTKTALTDSLGAATTSFYVPAATGTYIYSVSFSTDGVYSASSSTGTMTAAQRPASVITEDVNTNSGADFVAKATLKDFATEYLITGATVTFVFEGSTKTAVTNGIGVATVTFTAPIPVGFYPYTASYAGGPVYAQKSASSLIGVGLRITSLVVPGLTVFAQDVFTAQATLLDGVIPVQGSTVSFVFQGSTQTAFTDASGIAVSTFSAPYSSGTYTCAASYPGDGTYAASTGSGNMTVNRRPLGLAGDLLQGYVNATFQARAVLSDGNNAQKVAGKTIVFVFESSSATALTDASGVSTVSFNSGSLPRASTCYYYFAGDAGYTFADSTGSVSIDRRPVSLAASDATALLSSSFTAIAELKDTAFTPAALPGKTITFSFLGSTRTAVTNSLGVASVTYQTGLSTGAFEFYVSFDQDGVYLADNDTGTVTLGKRPAVVSAYPKFMFTFDSMQAVADLKDGVTGEYLSTQTISFNYNGVLQSTTTGASGGISGRAYSVYPGTGVAATYSYYAEFAGNSLYYASGSTATISVSQRPVNLSAFPQTSIWGSTLTATAEFRDGITNAPVNGKNLKLVFMSSTVYSLTAGGGSASAGFDSPASTGSFNWSAEFAGDQAYSYASSTGTITVNRRAPTLTAIASTKYVWDSVFFSATFFDDGAPVASKQLSYFFRGSTLTATTNGSGLATAGPFASISTTGLYGYTVQFAGDTNYSAQSASSTLAVSSRPSNISLGPVSVIANSTFTISATLIDSLWATGVSGKAVSFTLQGATYAVSAVTNGSGIATAVYPSSTTTGPYTYSATFYGNSNYAGTSSSDTVTVGLRPTVIEMADFYPAAGSTYTASAVLKDFTTGVTLSTRTISFLFMGTTKNPVTNAVGYASATYVTLSSTASYPISASYAGDALYAGTSINKTVYPGKRNTALQTSDILNAVAKDTFTVTARLADYDLGTYIAGSTITFSFTGSSSAFTITAFTNASGIASADFTAPVSTGNYTYSASFTGTALYNANTNTSMVAVGRRTVTLLPGDLTSIPAGSTFTASALMTDGLTTLSTYTLTFNFSSTNKNAVTNGIGVASTSFAAPLSTGTSNYSVSFAGDALYKPATANGSVETVLRPAKLELGPVSVIAISTFTLTATLSDIATDLPIISKSVSFTLQSASYTLSGVTDSSGVARVVYTSSSTPGAYAYSATFGGNSSYSGAYSSNTVTVTVRPTVLEMADYNPPANSTFTASAVLKDFTTGATISTKTVSFLFMGNTKTANTDSVGYASTTYLTLASTISYPISASYAGSSLYSAASISKVVLPGKRNTALQTSNIPNAVALDTFTVTARLSDYDLGTFLSGSTITFSFSGSSQPFTITTLTNSTGTASAIFTAPTATGTYTYSATFAGASLYNGTSSTSTVLVDRRTITIEPADLTSIPAGSTITVSALMKDGAITLSTKTLSFVFSLTKTAVTNGIGVASTTFLAPLSTGTFSYTVSYAGDALYKPGSGSGSVGVVLKPTVLEVLDVPDAVVGLNFEGTAKLRDIEMGNALVPSTKSITFIFTTSTIHSVTSVGVATASMVAPLIVGTYTYTASFPGDSTYGASQSTGTVTVKRRPVIFSVDVPAGEPYTLSTFTIKGTLVDGKTGEALAAQWVDIYFKVANTTHTVQTDAVGIATTSFYAGISSGSYLYSGTYGGNASYDTSEVNEQTVKTIKINPRPTSVLANLGNGEVTWNYAFWPQSPTVYVFDPLAGNIGVAGLTVSFIVNASTITGVTLASPLGQVTSSSPFTGTYFEVAGTTPATARFDGNQTYAPSSLPGGTNWAVPQEGKIRTEQAPATFGMDAVIETYPDMDTVVSATLLDWWNRPYPNSKLKDIPVRYRLSTTPCTLPACAEARTWDGGHWGTVNSVNVATATIHSPTEQGDYPIDYYFATTPSFVHWQSAEVQRVLRVGLRPTDIDAATSDPLEVGAQMPITIKVKLKSTSQGDIGVVGKSVVITFNGGAPQTVTTVAGGIAQYTFAGMPVGTYNYTATFAGDTAYNAASLVPSGTVSVVKNTTFLVGTPVTNVPAGNDFTAKATLNVLVGTAQEPAAGRTITFTFTGNADANAVTNAQGIAQVTFTSPQTPGNYSFTADLPTNANDLAATALDPTNRVQVIKRRTTLVSVSANPVYILDNFTSTATLTDTDAPPNLASLIGQTINFTLHRGGAEGDIGGTGATLASPLGQATKVFLSPASSGSKSYTAAFAGTALYEAVTAADVGVNVLKRSTVLSATSEPTAPTNTIFTATVTLRDNTPTLGASIPMGTGVNVPVKFVYDGVTRYGTTNDSGVATATFTAQAVASDYTCDITYEGNATYALYNLSLPVHVIKRTTHVTGTAILNQPAGAQFVAQATLTDDITGSGINLALINFVFTGGGTFNDSGTTNVSGVTSAVFTAPLSTGIYNYTACYPGDNTYAGYCDNANSVTVDVASTTLATPDGTVTVNNIFFATATLKGKESGVGVANKTVSFTYNGVLKGTPATDAAGIAIQSFVPASTGTFQLDVSFAGDSAFYPTTSSATITVTRRLSGIALPNPDTEVDALFIATVTLRDLTSAPSTLLAGRTVDFMFNATGKSAVTNALGVATVTYTGPPAAGSYAITASFAGDPIYISSATPAWVNVAKHNTGLTVVSNTLPALELFNATATLKWGLTPVPGKVIHFTYKGAGVDSAPTDANGQAFFQYNSGPVSGPWQLDAAFQDGADSAYNISSGTNTITVLPRNCLVRPDNITMATFDTFNATATFKDVASSSTPAGKYPKIALAWVVPDTATVPSPTDSAGKAYRTSLTAPSSSGTYKVEAWYAGDATYAPSPASTATVIVLPRASQLSLADAAAMIGRVFTATATLRNDTTLLGDKDVVFTFEGKNFSAKTGTGGLLGVAVATFTVTLSTGPNRIDANFAGDASYSASPPSSATVTAGMRLTYLSTAATSAIADRDFIATATFRDADFQPGKDMGSVYLATETISFLFNGVTHTAVTNSLGVATVTFTASVSTGSWPVAVSFAGSYKYISTSTVIPLTVNMRPTSLVSAGNIVSPALDIFTDTVTLKDLDNLTLDAKSLRFVFSGSTFTKITAGGGLASSTFTAPASAGTYFVNVYFDGDTKYSSSTVAITLTAQQRLTAIALNSPSATALDLFRTTATLTDPNNAALKVSTRQVTFSFSAWGSTSAVTDGVGVATASYQATATAGAYTLTGTFAGDSTYASTTTSVAFPVAKRSGFVTGVFVSTRVYDVFTASATFLDSASSAPVSGRTVKFSLQGGGTLSAPTNASGIAAVNFTAPAASGTYNISIWSDGTSDLTYSTTTVYVSSVTLARRDCSITLTGPAASIINSSFTPTATLVDPLPAGNLQSKLISFLFQASTVTATTGGSWSTSTVYTANLSSGPYQLQASFAGDASYNPSVSGRTVTMLRYPTLITAPAITVVMNEVLTATATLTDYRASTVPAKDLVFYFQSSSQTATTNGLGVSSTAYTVSLASGAYLLPVSFAGDALYDSTNTTIPVLVNKRTAVFTPDPVSAKALDIFTATTTLSDLRNPGLKVQGETVTFNFLVAGSTFPNYGVTNVNGVAASTFTAPVSSGTYQIRTFFAGSATYYPLLVYSTITVVSRQTMLMQDNSGAAIDEIFRTTATLVDLATLQVIASRTVAFTFGSSSSGVTGADGKATVTFAAPPASGTVQLNSAFAGDATYQAASSTASLVVSRRPASMAAPDISGIIDEVFTATVTVSDGLNAAKAATRTIAFVFSGSTFTAVTNVNGVAVSTFSAPVSSGVYYAAVNFAGDARYLPTGTTVQLTVDRRPSQISPDVITAWTAKVFTATATLRDTLNISSKPAGQPLVFYFAGSSFTALTDANGIAVSTFMAPASSGTARLDISFSGNSRYQASSSSAAISVQRRLTDIALNPASIRAMEVLTATGTLTDRTSQGALISGRQLVFSFSSVNFTTSTVAGVAVSTFAGPVSSGTYLLEASFPGDALYDAAYSSGLVSVTQRPARLMQDNSGAAIDELFYTTATLVDLATSQLIASRTVGFTFGSTSFAPTGADGKAAAGFTAPPSSGAYQLSSAFAGDATYAAAASTATLTVIRRPVSMAAPDISGIIDEVFTATVTVSDGLNAIKAAGRGIAFVFSGSTFTVATNAEGVAVSTFAAPASAGLYYAAINFSGDSRYLPAGTTVQLSVDRRPSGISAGAITTRAGQVFTATATLRDTLDISAKPAGQPLVFYFSGNSFTALTDADGVAFSTFMAPSSSGTARLDISFAGDARYQASASTAAVTVLRRQSAITIDPAAISTMDLLTSTATLSDLTDPAAFVNGRELRFTFSGENFLSVTDAGGIAVSTFAGPASSGTYLVEADFAGDAIYEASYSSGSVTVIQRQAGVSAPDTNAYPFEDLVVSGSIKDLATGVAVAGRELLFVLDGVSTGALTSAVGVATAPYTPPGVFGDYRLDANFTGDATYAAASSTATVSVLQRPTGMAALDAGAIALDVFTASATLSDVRFSTAVAGKEVVFNFEGQQSSATTDSNGLAMTHFDAPVSSGVYFYGAEFHGDLVYAVSSTTGAITVVTRNTRVVARDTNANVGEPFVLEAQVLDPAREEQPGYFVPNAEVEFKFKDRNNVVIDTKFGTTNEIGKATAAFSGPGLPDVYYYTARFTGNYTYSTSSATAMVKVGLLTSMVAFDVETVALADFNVKAKLTDYLATTLDDKTVRFTFLGTTRSGMTNAGGDSGVVTSSFTAPATAGAYYYNAYFDGDSIYSASNATATVVVKLRPSSILTYPAATMAYSSFTAVALLKNTLSPYDNIGGREVNIAFNGSTVTVNTDPAAGTASAVFFAPVSSGTFNFTASFAGDDTYDASSAVGSLIVTLRPTSMLSYGVSDLTANSTFTARIQIKDNANLPIAGLSVDFDFGGTFGIGVTDAQGYAETIYTAPASSGVYSYSATFYGDPYYSGSAASGSVTVGPRPTILFTTAASGKLGSPVELSARLLDVKNQAGIEGQTLNFYFNGSTLTALTDSYGGSTVTFASPVSTGSYYYEAVLDGDGITYIGSFSSAPVTIALNLTKLEAKDGISLKIYEPLKVEAVIKDSLGLQLPGLPINFSFEGQNFSGLTNEVGKATSTFSTMSLPSTGTYNYSADYTGDTLFVASIDTSNIVTVYRRDSLLIARDAQNPPNKAFIAEARFYDNVNGSAFVGSAVSGKGIIFELHDSTYTQTRGAVTSALGVATVTFVSPVSTGTYLMTARFAEGDPVYEAALSTASMVVLFDDGTGAIKTKMRVDSAVTYINHVFTASGTLTASDIPVAEVPVLFEFFNGIATYTAAGVTNGAGLAVSTFMAPASSGTYIITAAFPGDVVYSAATGTSTVSAFRYPDTLTAQDVAAFIGEDFRAKAVLRDELTLAYVAGKTIAFEYFDGVSTITRTAVTSSTGSAETNFTAPAALGNYTYTARFAGDALYAGNTDTASVLIAAKGSSTFLVGYDVFIGTGEVFAASATITSKGLPVQGKAVKITFQGLTRVSTSNVHGLAFSTFTAPASSGTFTYDAEFIGDMDYNAALTTAAVSAVFRKPIEQPIFKVEVTSSTVIFALPKSSGTATFTIEESASLRGVTTSSASVAASTGTTGYTAQIDPDKATFIKVKKKLDDNQEGQATLIVEIPSKAEDPERVPNYYYMSKEENNWAAWVKIPGKVMDKVGAADFSMEVKKDVNPAFLAAYTITSSGASADLASNLKASNKNGVKLTIAYPQAGAVASAASGQLAIYWFNGIEWIKLGGEIDVLTGEIYTYSRVLGQFAIRAAPLASVFTVTKVAPRIFSPDEPDPLVNRARFYFENPGGGEVTIRIFDITGALVRRNLESEGSNIMFWNGKDQAGVLVRGGIYIYQIEATDKVITGTVVVAK
ncbi:MAG: DUF2341 domain-containing protein [Elusimicrobiales bacterium]|nr:DUF2341 domain-containing protein [Elusimicrobiales bacterium]